MFPCFLVCFLFQLILNPIRDWKENFGVIQFRLELFQLILNPIRDWKRFWGSPFSPFSPFQLILNPIRDWKGDDIFSEEKLTPVPINLKPY